MIINQIYSDTFRVSSSSFGQQIDYAYNERGWVAGSSTPLFAMELGYNSGGTPQYDGNISF